MTNSEPGAGEEAGTKLSTKGSCPSSCSPSPIYPSSLDSSHFRLIYLTESEDISAPIHIQLEEYSFRDHPEYETVSYVWGGEEGDSTLCKPVYVGRYWDVILTTKNCSALLYYLRSQKVCRVIWLDAICINQADNVEKPAQISRMGDIYARCERVVAYLGDDLVSRPSGRTFRPRIDFRKRKEEKSAEFIVACAESAGLNEDQLLKRRYLTRIWIVQELWLPTEAIFPLGDLDILCYQEEAMGLILRGDREQPDISAAGDNSLSHLLMATSHCHASDPRDRVYGVLGLFKPQDHSQRLVPDYSISWRDCWLGTAAYILLVEKDLRLLIYCVGNNHPWHLPSWVPDIQNAKSWIIDNCQRDLDAYGYNVWDSCSETCQIELHESITAFGKLATQFVMYSRDCKDLRPHSLEPSDWWLQLSHRLVHSGALSTMSLELPMVDSSNGAFQLGVLRIFDRPHQLKLESGGDGVTSIWALGPSTAAHFRVMGMQEPMALNESYHLFLISCGNLDSEPDSIEWRIPSSQNILLALATADLEKDSSFVTLHGCYLLQYVDFRSMDHLGGARAGVYRTTNSLHSLHWVLHNLQQAVINSPEAESSCDWIFSWMFPSPKVRARDILPLLIKLTEPKLCSDEQSAFNQSLSETSKSLCPDFNPVIQGDYFHLTIKNKTMLHTLFWMRRLSPFYETNFVPDIGEEYPWHLMDSDSLEMKYTYPIVQDGEGWTSFNWFWGEDFEWDNLCDGINYPVTIRFRLRFLLSRIKRTTTYTAMLYAREFAKLLDEDLETFLSRTPRPEDRHVFFEAWGRSLVEELGLVWKLERITIV